PSERHGLGATKQHGVMRVQAKWTQRIDHCAADINRFSEKFRRFFGSASGLAAKQGTNCRPSGAVSDKGSAGAERCPGRFRLMPTTATLIGYVASGLVPLHWPPPGLGPTTSGCPP